MQRTKMMNDLHKIAKFTIATLLFGDKNLSETKNKAIFDCVHNFMDSTKRFS